MSNPHTNVSGQIPNQATPLIVDASNMDDGITINVTPGSGTNTILCQFTCTPNASPLPIAQQANVNWFPCTGTGLTAGVTSAGASVSFTVPYNVTAFKFTRQVAGSGTDIVEICS